MVKKKKASRKMLNRLNDAIKEHDKQEVVNAINELDAVDWTLHSFKFQEQYEVLFEKANQLFPLSKRISGI